MKESNRYIGTPLPTMLTRTVWIVMATAIGLLLTLTVVLAQAPDFELSYKSGPLYAKTGDVITYTIVAVNTGDTLATNVVLSDVLPGGALFITDSCSYDYGSGSLSACGPLGEMWRLSFFPGTRITTTFAATVTAVATGTLRIPLVNHAYIHWDSGQQPLVFTTTVLAAVPEFELFYQPTPPNADTGSLITYTIVAVNTGDPVSGITLSDTLPGGVAFAPGSCTYDVGPHPPPGSLDIPCNDLVPGQRRPVWQADMSSGARITTTFLVTVTVPPGSARWPLQNCAYLGWNVIQEEACATSLANPTFYIRMPLVARNYDNRRDLYEPNDTSNQAYGPLISGQVYAAYIWNIADLNDYYHFTPSTGASDVYITLTNIPANCNYDLFVYDSPTSPIPLTYSNQSGNANESVTFTPIAGQRYYILIYRSSGSSNQQPYHLTVTYQ